MAGDGMPNFGITPHHEGSNLLGYFCWYHDQQVTGNDRKWSPQMSVANYAELHDAANTSQSAFEAEWASGAWAAFSGLYTGIDLGAARQSAKLVTTPP